MLSFEPVEHHNRTSITACLAPLLAGECMSRGEVCLRTGNTSYSCGVQCSTAHTGKCEWKDSEVRKCQQAAGGSFSCRPVQPSLEYP